MFTLIALSLIENYFDCSIMTDSLLEARIAVNCLADFTA